MTTTTSSSNHNNTRHDAWHAQCTRYGRTDGRAREVLERFDARTSDGRVATTLCDALGLPHEREEKRREEGERTNEWTDLVRDEERSVRL